MLDPPAGRALASRHAQAHRPRRHNAPGRRPRRPRGDLARARRPHRRGGERDAEGHRHALRLGRHRAGRQARLRQGLRAGAHHASQARHARDPLPDRLGLQGVHGRGRAAPAGGRQALARRQGLQVVPGADRRRQGEPAPAPDPHLRLLRLLAAGLCAGAVHPPHHAPCDHGRVGQAPARLRAGRRLAVLQHRLRHRGRDHRQGGGRAAVQLPEAAGVHAAAHAGGRHRRAGQPGDRRRHGLPEGRAGPRAPRPGHGRELAVRGGRDVDHRRRRRPLGRQPDQPLPAEAGELRAGADHLQAELRPRHRLRARPVRLREGRPQGDRALGRGSGLHLART